MPLSAAAARVLAGRAAAGQRASSSGDGFSSGDYSLGLFHHDASEASIALLDDPEFRDAAAGSLLCLLDCADPDGRVHRAELPHKAREAEPSKPVIAQYALRCTRALGPSGPSATASTPGWSPSSGGRSGTSPGSTACS